MPRILAKRAVGISRTTLDAGASSESLYDRADERLLTLANSELGFRQLMAVRPRRLDRQAYDLHLERHGRVLEFFDTTLRLFVEALAEGDRELLRVLLNDTPASLGWAYHRSLDAAHFSMPVFFRTDETPLGKIVELQCPGSLWGEYQLVLDSYDDLGIADGERHSLAHRFGRSLSALLGATPLAHHLLDNASIPDGMRYFIARTRPLVRYYGIDAGLEALDCNFIRSHSFFGLLAENFAKQRLELCHRGRLRYDLPPIVLFDQKAAMALPFWRQTRQFYSDDVRALFPHTSLVTPNGVELRDGSVASVREFSLRPRSGRRYYLKYAGSDVSINWGSRAVFNLAKLGREACERRLQSAADDFRRNRVWILQQAVGAKSRIEYVTREGDVRESLWQEKLSSFYGPDALLGVMSMHRPFYKVHGNRDTVVSICLPEGRERVRRMLDRGAASNRKAWVERPTAGQAGSTAVPRTGGSSCSSTR